VHEQAHAEDAGPRCHRLAVGNEQRDRLAGPRDHNALAGMHTLEQL
jgi:hypothetical protein